MLEFILEVAIWCLCIYGIMSLLNDIIEAHSYKRVQENVKIILTVKDVEAGIESYIRELRLGKNFFNNLVVIDLNSEDNTLGVLNEMQKDYINMKTLSKEEGREYLEQMLSPVED